MSDDSVSKPTFDEACEIAVNGSIKPDMGRGSMKQEPKMQQPADPPPPRPKQK